MVNELNHLDTPALLLNLNKVEKNIDDIAIFAKEAGVNVRPHIKTHKSIDIAKRQIEAGSVGVTVAKVGEAEVMVEGGIRDVLIAYPLVSTHKLERVLPLMKRAYITVAVDSIEQATALNRFFAKKSHKLNVWIKVNSGLNRVGVEPNKEVIELAKHVTSLDHLSLTGIFTHAGQSYAAQSLDQVKDIAKREAQAVINSANLCEKSGIHIEHRSVGSTPTFKYSGLIKGITEIRPGNAVFYDMVQVGLGVADEDDCALTVLTSLVSKKDNRLVIDAGSKTLALDKGAHGNESIMGHGLIIKYPQLIIERLSEEHGVIPLKEVIDISLGEKLRVIPNHACTVVNLFDHYVVHRDGKVIDTWEVSARGHIQ